MRAETNTRKNIEKITWIGLVANVALAVIKLIIGVSGSSQAVVADAMHSFSDTASDLVILFGVRYWTAPPDDCHPFGHQKIESFVTIVISLILLGVATGIGYNAIVSLMHPVTPRLGPFVLAAPLLSLVVKEILYRITFAASVTNRSSSLKANAWHHRTDALSSIPVLVAVTAGLISPKLAFLDPVAAILVSVFIIKVGIDILGDSLAELTDKGMSPTDRTEIQALIQRIPHVQGTHRIRSRKIGGSFHMDLHLEVDGQMSVRQGHDISETVRQTLMKQYPKIIDVTVHLEPADENPGIKPG
ncbi:MAG: cation diffusion facilitator family transporter [Desulfotignum sp.]|nr:cation diffusion facilitator family transporter [Desulfotignum sp.]